jgi:hypothetical protein
VRLHVLDHPDDRRDALFTPVRWIVWDGHGMRDPGPGFDDEPLQDVLGSDNGKFKAEVLIVGCCWGAAKPFTDIIGRHLETPIAYVGCKNTPGKTEGGILYPRLLETLARQASGTDPGTLVTALRSVIATTISANTKPKSLGAAGWTAMVLPSAS